MASATRELTRYDGDIIFDLMMKRYLQLSKVGGVNSRTSGNVEEQFKIFMDEHMDFAWTPEGLPSELNAGRAIGVWDKGELRMIVTQRFATRRLPTWYVGNMITDPDYNNFYKVTKGMAEAIDGCADYAEEKGYTQFYWVTSTKAWNKREQIWYNASKTFKRYNVFIENIVPAGQEPKFDVEKMLLGYRTHPIDLAIKCAKIKPHIRHEHFQKQGLIKVDYIPLQEEKNEFNT